MFPEHLVQFNDKEALLHQRLMELRHQVYAHSDSASHSIRPFKIGDHVFSDMVGAPFLLLKKDECELIVSMIDGIFQLLRPELEKLRMELVISYK